MSTAARATAAPARSIKVDTGPGAASSIRFISSGVTIGITPPPPRSPPNPRSGSRILTSGFEFWIRNGPDRARASEGDGDGVGGGPGVGQGEQPAGHALLV